MARAQVLAAVVTSIVALLAIYQLSLTFILPALPIFPSLSNTNHEKQVLSEGEYLIGVGKGDITGPVVEINMMGYADTAQSGTGLRQRLYCRAFIIGSTQTPSERVVYLVLDTQSGDTAVRHGIIEGLRALGNEYEVYTKNNIAVTGTHSHSGPGAWLNYLLPQVTSKGFYKDSYQAIVDGSVLAIQRAHQNLVSGHLSIGTLEVEGVNINRSPYAYLANPKAERGLYKYDVDKTMTVLNFERASDNLPIGLLSWYAVHGTSLFQNNTLITGDNKGVAANLLENSMKKDNPDFVAGFSQSNVGDTSPNILGAVCEDTGLECRFNDSTCDGKTAPCRGRGPYFRYLDQGTRSGFEIGRRQYAAAKQLLGSSLDRLSGSASVSSFHTFVNMSSYTFPSLKNASQMLQTCSAALGHGFAGGTTDGPGAFDFKQGTNDSDDSPSLKNPLWKAARRFVHEPSDEQILCQHPKPILLDVGAAEKPYAWTPNIVDIQVLRVGPLIIIVAPGEATTMSGRRWRNAIASAAPSILSISQPHVVLGGPANTYAHYIATEEEYKIQRYEGASTLFGPHTLEAYINLTLTNLPYLGSPSEVKKLPPLHSGPSPPINTNASLSFIRPVVVDNAGFFRSFGQVLSSPSPSEVYTPGDVPATVFIGANPRNEFRLEGTFAAIEKLDSSTGTWHQVRDDSDWHLVYRWERKSTVLGTSEVTIEWEIEEWVEDGTYRMRYYGDAKGIGGSITPFEGVGDPFHVLGGREEPLGELARS
jgi:neutral ceramidase